MDAWVVVPIVVVVVLFVLYLSQTAARLDRLHHRVDTSWRPCRPSSWTGPTRSSPWPVLGASTLDQRAARGCCRQCPGAGAGQRSGVHLARCSAESALTSALEATFTDPQVVDELMEQPDGQRIVNDSDRHHPEGRLVATLPQRCSTGYGRGPPAATCQTAAPGRFGHPSAHRRTRRRSATCSAHTLTFTGLGKRSRWPWVHPLGMSTWVRVGTVVDLHRMYRSPRRRGPLHGALQDLRRAVRHARRSRAHRWH